MTLPTILFPSTPYDLTRVDDCFYKEFLAAKNHGFQTGLIDLRKDNWAFNFSTTKTALYRGWMLTSNDYKNLYNLLEAQETKLITNWQQYLNCHHANNNIDILSNVMPKSVVVPFSNDELFWKNICETLNSFGSKSILVKDYVKSEKYYWDQACFIPDASDCVCAKNVIKEFLRLRGEDFVGGLVFKEFVDLHVDDSRKVECYTPAIEIRFFCSKPNILAVSSCKSKVNSINIKLPQYEELLEVIKNIDSPLFTMDIAFAKNGGNWFVLEVGDGQVSDLYCEEENFYKWLKSVFNHKTSGVNNLTNFKF